MLQKLNFFTTKITTLGQGNTRQNKKGGGTGNWGDKIKRLNGLKGGVWLCRVRENQGFCALLGVKDGLGITV